MLSKIMSLTRLYSALRDVTALPDNSLIDVINDYYVNQLPQEVKLPELAGFITLETTAGIDQYPLDQSVLDLNYPKLYIGDQVYSHLEQTYCDEPQGGQDRPQLWRWQGDQITFYPTPDDAYLVKFSAFTRPAALVNLTDEPVRTDLQELIALGAARLILNRLGDVERALKSETQYQKLIAEASSAAFARREHFPMKRSF